MALIKCTECQKDISDKASACPNCGNPMLKSSEDNVVTVQLTQKKWKKQKLIAIIILIIGWFMLMKGMFGGGGGYLGLGIFLMLIGFISGITARLGAWWSNG